MFSVLLNVLTIVLVAVILVGFAALVKQRTQDPDVSASDVMQPLITGDRLREVWNVNMLDLMSGSEGTFLPNDAETTLELYSFDGSAVNSQPRFPTGNDADGLGFTPAPAVAQGSDSFSNGLGFRSWINSLVSPGS